MIRRTIFCLELPLKRLSLLAFLLLIVHWLLKSQASSCLLRRRASEHYLIILLCFFEAFFFLLYLLGFLPHWGNLAHSLNQFYSYLSAFSISSLSPETCEPGGRRALTFPIKNPTICTFPDLYSSTAFGFSRIVCSIAAESSVGSTSFVWRVAFISSIS